MLLLTILGCLVLVIEGHQVTLDGVGALAGKEHVARGGVKYLSFLGIPYAQPPVGDLRWKLPVPVQGWEGVRDASSDAAMCAQYPYHAPDHLVGSEDCLYLSVHTRSLEGNKPVIVYIHGGSFLAGGASKIGGEAAKYIMEQDVVYVAIQYRLGPFGFLSTEDSASSGNFGLHDQRLALKWIQQHIAKFGGNKDQVTLMGMSAGGASVHYHVLSPGSDGLFHRAMAMSGSALCWWANIKTARKHANRLAESLECPTEKSSDLIECLRGKSVEEIMDVQRSLYFWKQGRPEVEPLTIWAPRVDTEAGDNAILPVDPTLAMSAGQIQPIPFLVGVADSEGAWRANAYLNQDENMAYFLKNFDEIAPYALGLKDEVREDEMQEVINKIKKYYLFALTEEKDLDKRLKSVVQGMIHMFGDTMFNFAIDRMAKLHGNKDYAPVWVYVFNYKSDHSLAMFDSKNPGKVLKKDQQLELLKRPTHAAEVSMLFPMFEKDMGPLSDEETKVSQKFVQFLYDFTVLGHPNQDGKYEMRDWKPVADGQLSHFIWGKYNANTVGLPFQKRMKWWSKMPVYWNKSAPVKATHEDQPTTCTKQAEVDPDKTRYAEDAEELSDEELEEAKVETILNDMKDEL